MPKSFDEHEQHADTAQRNTGNDLEALCRNPQCTARARQTSKDCGTEKSLAEYFVSLRLRVFPQTNLEHRARIDDLAVICWKARVRRR